MLTVRHERSGESLAEDADWAELEASVRELLALPGGTGVSGGRTTDLIVISTLPKQATCTTLRTSTGRRSSRA